MRRDFSTNSTFCTNGSVITIELEEKLSKKEIFEHYSNQNSLSMRGSFSIRGFGQASQAYFGKDIRNLTIHEAATLAAIPRNPTYYNPYRHPDHAKLRRNLILSMMRQNGFISDRQYAVESEAPLGVVGGGLEGGTLGRLVDRQGRRACRRPGD